MLRVVLVNMPFADWNRPSFALSQLTAVTRRELPDAVDVRVLYLNQDIVEHIGVSMYEAIAGDVEHLTSGVGDWLFARLAFPGAPDTADEYLARYYSGARWSSFRDRLLRLRDGLSAELGRLMDAYAVADADVVGLTSMFAQNTASIALARLAKERNPRLVTVMGGANCEAPMGAALVEHAEPIDFVFSGPALRTFPDFLRCLLDEPRAAHAIPGVLSRENAGDPTFRRAIGPDRDIDEFFEPDYESFRGALAGRSALTAADGGGAAPILAFETSRGCWWGERSHCTFCGLNGLTMRYRSMAPEMALRQFRWLFRFYPWCSAFHCTDNIMPRSYLKEVFPRLDTPEGASIFYEVKVPIADSDLEVMARAGVNTVQPGIEALATSTLRLMGKGTTAFQNLQFLKSCVRYGIEPHWNLLIGFPGEEEAVFQKYARDIPLLAHLPPPTGVHLVRFDRYSPYLTRSAEYGLDLRPMDFYGLVYPMDAGTLEDLAYYFADHKLAEYVLAAAAWVKPLRRLTDEWRRRWAADRGRAELSLGRDLGVWRVRDTRYGDEEWFEVAPTARALLRCLAVPRRRDRLAAESGLDSEAVDGALHLLLQRGLLFEEDDRLLSLVSLEEGA
jgi:magnesium-protoporphyrin IX monomethyl ester (oxidative) cyclase